MNGEWKNGVTKGREYALKYAAGVHARGERRYAIFERTVKNIPVEYFLAMERNHGFPILWPSFPLEGENTGLSGETEAERLRVRRQPLWEKRFRRFS